MENNNNTKPRPIKVDFQNIRIERQKLNNLLVFNSIKQENIKKFDESINKEELKRVLEETELTREELLHKCRENDILGKVTSGRISKNATRQGTKDEAYQIDICDSVSKKFGISILNLPNTAYRPTKDGRIISKNDMEKNNITIDMCLKSFDGKIEGELKGWIFAKVVFNGGGHQDNVIEEADCLCEWVSKYKKDEEELFVLLIDTNLTNNLDVIKKKYEQITNLLIVNHVEFQTYLINKYYKESI